MDYSKVSKVLQSFQRRPGLFNHSIYTKIFAVVLLSLSCLGTKGVKDEKITWKQINIALGCGIALFFFNFWILNLTISLEIKAILYILTTSAGFISLLMAGAWMSRLLKSNLMEDVFNIEKVAVCLGFQDFSQLTRDYGDKESKVIQNMVGNIFSGQVVGETTKTLSERFGKVLQKRQSMTINRSDKLPRLAHKWIVLFLQAKYPTLHKVCLWYLYRITLTSVLTKKIFHVQIVVDTEKVAKETKADTIPKSV